MAIKVKKFLSLIIAAATLLVTATTLIVNVSCSSNEGADSQQTTAAETVAETEYDPLAARAVENDNVPQDVDFEGETFRMLSRGIASVAHEFTIDAMDGDVVDDAVYNRNLKVEDRLNVTIEEEFTGEYDWHGTSETLKTFILSDDPRYDVATGSMYGMAPSTLNNYYINLHDIDYLDFDRVYWSSLFNDGADVAGRLFMTTGSVSLYLLKNTYVFFYNKKVAEDYQLSDMYTLVKDGGWTLDKMCVIAENVYSDVNGDGARDVGDLYGFGFSITEAADGFWSSFDIGIVSKDEDGNPVLDVNVDKLTGVVAKLYNFVWENAGTAAFGREGEDDSSGAFTSGSLSNLADDRLIFFATNVINTEYSTLRDMKSDYGILPYPKYDETQEKYYSYAHDGITVLTVPIIAKNPSLSGAVLEVMASENYNSVVPVYYGIALSEKYARDPDSVEMLDIIYGNLKLDTGWVFSAYLNNLPQELLRNMIRYKKQTVASKYESMSGGVSKLLDKLYSVYGSY